MTIFPVPGNLTHIGLVGSYGALLVGWSVVVVPGLYLAGHVFTLLHLILFILLVVTSDENGKDDIEKFVTVILRCKSQAKYVGIKLLEMLLAVME